MAIAILAILTAIVGAVADTGKAVLDTISSFFQSIFTLFQSFVQSAPMPMRIAIFLFFILTFGNVFSNFILGTAYACDGNNILYQTGDIVTAMQGILKIKFQNPTITDRNNFIHTNYQLASQKPSPTNVKCVATQPKMFFYSINILDYNLWLLLLVVLFGVPMIWGYYSRMGILGGH